jgi:hypothetical protein
MAEKKDVEINSRADTIDLMHPDIRPWPVSARTTSGMSTPLLNLRPCKDSGLSASVSGEWATSLPAVCSVRPGRR